MPVQDCEPRAVTELEPRIVGEQLRLLAREPYHLAQVGQEALPVAGGLGHPHAQRILVVIALVRADENGHVRMISDDPE